jgi:hypothetical protein
MVDVRKIVIIFVIAVLFAVFSQTLIEAVYPSPKYEDYCVFASPKSYPAYYPGDTSKNCSFIDTTECEKSRGFAEFKYNNATGCPTSYTCNYCQKDFDNANNNYSLFVFIVSSLIGLIGVAIGLFMPAKKNDLNEWIGTGFMLGGMIAIFIGTARYFAELGRYIRPIVIFIELVIVIFIAYKKLKK